MLTPPPVHLVLCLLSVGVAAAVAPPAGVVPVPGPTGLGGQVQQAARQAKDGACEAYRSFHTNRKLRTRRRADGLTALTFAENIGLQRAGDDRGKMFSLAMFAAFNRELLPIMLAIWPMSYLPSAFETPAERARRAAKLSLSRAGAPIGAAASLEKEFARVSRKGPANKRFREVLAQRRMVVDALAAASPDEALERLAVTLGTSGASAAQAAGGGAADAPADAPTGKPTPRPPSAASQLRGVPREASKAMCKALGKDSWIPFPGPRGRLATHLDRLHESDAALVAAVAADDLAAKAIATESDTSAAGGRGRRREKLPQQSQPRRSCVPLGLDAAPRAALLVACEDRAIGGEHMTNEQMRTELRAWLRALGAVGAVDRSSIEVANTATGTTPSPAATLPPAQARAALLALHAVHAARVAPEAALTRAVLLPRPQSDGAEKK